MKNDVIRKMTVMFLLLCVAFSGASGCAGVKPPTANKPSNPGTPAGELNQNALDTPSGAAVQTASFTRDMGKVDFGGLPFTPWDTAKAAAGLKERAKKPYTVLIYMNGSDLESEYGAATADLVEMLNSGLNPQNANLVILTGGTNRWRNNVVPSQTCALWEISGGYINKISDIGLVNMGDAGTLASFLDFGVKYFPAEKTGLIFWDHGGGSIAGYGHDEKFKDGTLTLLEMNYAFEKSAIKGKPFEFIGFDACLMASVEMAVVSAPYAKYFIASEELEPGDGWDYRFLAALNKSPAPDGAALGKHIVDTFTDFYGLFPDENISLSVTNLGAAGAVMGAMGALMKQASGNLAAQKTALFNTLAKKRNNTKTFGVGSPRDNESDMVDVGDMAEKLKDLFPAESAAVLSSLQKCVVYNRHNSDINLCGLSAYYIYGGKSAANVSLGRYSGLKMEDNYTSYLGDFYGYLSAAGNTRARSDSTAGTRALINGKSVRMYKISRGRGFETFAVPVCLNGENADIIISIGERNPQGIILGARREQGFIIQKGCDPIKDGDKISFYYEKETDGKRSRNDAGIKWHMSKETTVKGGLTLELAKPVADLTKAA